MINYFYREYWNIAIRPRKDNCILDDTHSSFHLIENGRDYWLADPFLFEYEGNCYIFVELYDCKKGKGVIAFQNYSDPNDSVWHTAIEEEYHLSFPFIFREKEDIYIIPESSYGKCLSRYKAIDFPYRWEKELIINDVSIVDTALGKYGDKYIGLTTRLTGKDNAAYLISCDEDFQVVTISEEPFSDDDRFNRLAGAFFDYNNERYVVFQDGQDYYGKELHFMQYDKDEKRISSEKIGETISIDSRKIIIDSNKKFIGIHTYNISDNYEVIDLKHMEVNVRHIMFSIIRKIRKMICGRN